MQSQALAVRSAVLPVKLFVVGSLVALALFAMPQPAQATSPLCDRVNQPDDCGTGLTEPQIQAILSMLSAFNVEQAVITNVSNILHGNTEPVVDCLQGYVYSNGQCIFVIPAGSFSASPTSGSAPLPVSFGLTNADATHYYTITFGDTQAGGFARNVTSGTVSHTYTAPGVYTAALIERTQCSATECLGPSRVVDSKIINVSSVQQTTSVAPAAPTGLGATCNAAGTQATLSWSGTGASYLVRLDDTTNNSASCTDGWLCAAPDRAFSGMQAGGTYDVTPGHLNRFWVHATDQIGNYSLPSVAYSFTCSAPVTQTQTCPTGYTGTYPNCVAPQTPTCAAGQTGTYPNCVTPSTTPPSVTVAPQSGTAPLSTAITAINLQPATVYTMSDASGTFATRSTTAAGTTWYVYRTYQSSSQIFLNNAQGSHIASTNVNVSAAPAAAVPTCTLSAAPSPFQTGQAVTFSWTKQNAAYVSFFQDQAANVLGLPASQFTTSSYTLPGEANGLSAGSSATVTLYAYSSDGQHGSCTTSISRAAAPVVTTSAISMNNGSALLATASFTSNNCSSGSFTLDWGDGQTQDVAPGTGQCQGGVAAGGPINYGRSHNYSSYNTYTVRLLRGSTVLSSATYTATPPKPVLNQVQCNNNGTVTLSWSVAPGSKIFYPLRYQANGITCPAGFYSAHPDECDIDNVTNTTLTVPVTRDLAYTWWVHTADYTDYSAWKWSAPTIATFSCSVVSAAPSFDYLAAYSDSFNANMAAVATAVIETPLSILTDMLSDVFLALGTY